MECHAASSLPRFLPRGVASQADYCPFYHVEISNHICTDPHAMTFPISNVNFERSVGRVASMWERW